MKKIILSVLLLLLLDAYSQTQSPKDDGRIIRIPIVFHVIHFNESISDSLIINELKDLNLDFNSKNDMSVIDNDFKKLIGNPNIEFYLLDSIFSKKDSKGINRISNSKHIDKILINPKNVVNVIIKDHGNSSDILGEKINLNYSKIGYNTHVLTHEMGHWLGLYHTWGKTGSCNRFKLLFSKHDDLIEDTPKQYKCTDLSFSSTCPPRNIYYKDHKILYNNFMDYSGCRCMFTIKQSVKMRNNIIEFKTQIYN